MLFLIHPTKQKTRPNLKSSNEFLTEKERFDVTYVLISKQKSRLSTAFPAMAERGIRSRLRSRSGCVLTPHRGAIHFAPVRILSNANAKKDTFRCPALAGMNLAMSNCTHLMKKQNIYWLCLSFEKNDPFAFIMKKCKNNGFSKQVFNFEKVGVYAAFPLIILSKCVII